MSQLEYRGFEKLGAEHHPAERGENRPLFGVDVFVEA
jgi:hypothetical protein